MGEFKFNVDVNRNCVERYSVTVEAEDPEEAQDLIYEYFVDFPNGQDFLKTRLRTREQTNSVEVLNVEFERKESNDREAVFGEDN